MDLTQIEVAPILMALAQVVLGVVVLILAKLLKGWLSPYKTDEELTSRDNPAFGLALSGYYLAVVAIYIGTVRPAEGEVWQGFLITAAWSLAGIVALAFSRTLMNATLIAGARCSDQIVSSHNLAAGAVEFGVYVSAGLVLAGALREPGGTVLTAIVFFLLSQVVLLVLGRLYQAFAGYAIAKEICNGNLAAGTAFGLTLIALSLLMVKATSGEFIDWTTNLSFFAFDAIVGFILLMGLRWVTDLALLPNARIADEVVRDRNPNAGLMEGVIAIAVALLILFVF